MLIKKHNDRKISEVLGEFIQKNKRIQIQHELKQIQDAWKSEMGSMINSYTTRFFIKNGRLEITLTSAPLRTELNMSCLLYTSPSPRDKRQSRMPSSA